MGLLSGCSGHSTDEKKFSSSELIGFWHSAPNFSNGFEELYRFFEYGEGFEYVDAKGTLYRGDWDVKDDGALELVFHIWDGEKQTEEPARNYDIKYINSDKGEEIATINGRKFWKLQEPADVINGIPLYIRFQSDNEEEYPSSEIVYVSHPHGGGHRNAVFSYDGDLYDFKIVIVSHSFDDGDFLFYYNQDDILFEMDHLPSNSIVIFENRDIGTMYMEAFSFRDAFGIDYAYALTHGGRGVPMDDIIKIDLINDDLK
jgi:hypothetical protein